MKSLSARSTVKQLVTLVGGSQSGFYGVHTAYEVAAFTVVVAILAICLGLAFGMSFGNGFCCCAVSERGERPQAAGDDGGRKPEWVQWRHCRVRDNLHGHHSRLSHLPGPGFRHVWHADRPEAAQRLALWR